MKNNFIEKNRMFYFVNLTAVNNFRKWIFIFSIIIIALQKRINEKSFYRKKIKCFILLTEQQSLSLVLFFDMR